MPAPDVARLISEVPLEGSLGWRQVPVRYGEQREKLGTRLLYARPTVSAQPAPLRKRSTVQTNVPS